MAKPQYIRSQTFFDGDRWAAHDFVGVLLARGVTQITIAEERDEFTVSWPEREPPAAESPTFDADGGLVA